MSEKNRLKIEKKKEMRTREISRMIDEGGLGADNYYNIVKDKDKDKELIKEADEDKDESVEK